MSRSNSIIPFHDLKFLDDVPSLRSVEERFRKFLKRARKAAQERAVVQGQMAEDDCLYDYELVTDKDMRRIKRRAMRVLERIHSSTGMYHLTEENRARLTPLRGGLPVARITTEHEADEIAAALHEEMPWMAPATEMVWQGLRASARDGLPGARFSPLVLVGSPGIGKSYWARRLAHHLSVPMTKIDATGEPATFALVGSQRGWGSAHPGKVMKTILQERHGGPLVILDEIEKAGETYSTRGSRHTLTDALLPLLERLTAASWECPFFQIKLDMSWVNWIMTANAREGLPEPLQSRCVVLDLPDLTMGQLHEFACSEGRRRCLPEPALAAVLDVFDSGAISNARLNLRIISRMLDRAELLAQQPMLN